MEKLKRNLEHTYKEKERLERNIKSLKRQADESFQRQMELEDQKNRHREAALNGQHGVSFTRDDLFSIDQKIEKARQECENFSNELKESKERLPEAEQAYNSAVDEYASTYRKWLEGNWKQYRKLCEQADILGDQLRDEAKFTHKFSQLPRATPRGRCIDTMKGASGVSVEFSPENQIKKLRKIA